MLTEFRDAAGAVVGTVRDYPPGTTKDTAGILAQRYMSQFSDIESAHIFDDATETVVSRYSPERN